MITDQDVKRLEAVFATKQEFKELRGEVGELRGEVGVVKTELSETRNDLANLEDKVDGLVVQVSQLPTKDDLINLIERAAGFATLRLEHDRMKNIIREHLKVEV